MTASFVNSIRFKLVLVSLTLLGIPWSGYYLVSEMESLLEDHQRESLVSQAQLVQQIMLASEFSFRNHRRSDLFVHEWKTPIEVDGYDDDWAALEKHETRIKDPDSDFAFDVAVGRDEDRFYLLLETVTPQFNAANGRDYVVIAIGNQFYRFMINAPGYVRPELWDESRQAFVDDFSTLNMAGAWSPTENGYRLEASWPNYRVKTNFGVRVHTSGKRRLRTVEPISSGRLILPVDDFEHLAEKFARNKMRIRIFDYQGWRLADVNRMQSREADEDAMPWLLKTLLHSMLYEEGLATYLFDKNATKIAYDLLDYSPDTGYDYMRRRSVVQDKVITSVAVPLIRRVGGAEVVSGTIFVEQSTDDILYMQDKALQKIVWITVGLFVVTSASLLLFATILTTRIRRLKTQLETSVSHDGRIIGQMQPGNAKDEIGDLGRGVSSVLNRLQEYNHYLEAMASRLTHELRTPLSVVKTSIENAKLSANDEQNKYLTRALSGADRLDDILKRLREATRLEQSLQDAHIDAFDLCKLASRQIEGLIDIWPDVDFKVNCTDQSDVIIGAPETVEQALEKLIGNAVDFHTPNTPIVISIERDKQYLTLTVRNQGIPLPDEEIFASMVSHREGEKQQPHMGLGLYIVKLVAEFHRGSTIAINHEDGTVEVGFSLRI